MKTDRAPMGWNSWDCWGAAVTEDTVRKNAEFIAKHLKPYGWEYVVVDIQWAAPNAKGHEYEPFGELNMDEYSRLIPAENRFPSSKGGRGFAPLAEYVHSLGLKFGIHIMRGIPRAAVHSGGVIYGTDIKAKDIARFNSICQWNPDMYGVDAGKAGAREYYDSIFRMYAEWGVDFIKCDDICRELPHELDELRLISEALHGSGRDMVFSLSPGPALLEYAEEYKQLADMWRITDDFWDKWELLYDMFSRAEKWCVHTGAGNWPDADMLPVGAILQDYGDNRTKFTEDEQITMLTLWCIFRSPLMIGGDLTKCDDFTLKLLTNERVLSMHKNARNSHPVWRKEVCGSEIILWTADCAEGGKYLAVFNAGEEPVKADIPLKDIELNGAEITELWSGESLSGDTIPAELAVHSAKAYHLI